MTRLLDALSRQFHTDIESNENMSTTSAKLLVFTQNGLTCIKIAGRANFTSSLDFKTVVEELTNTGTSCFVLDLSDCVLMDSTFLGVLAGFGLKMNPAQQPARHQIELLNPNPRISELLENLGVLHLFDVVNGVSPEMTRHVAERIPPAGAEPTREQVTRNCLEAHRTLMAIDPANIPKFKEVAQFLAEDLKKIKSES